MHDIGTFAKLLVKELNRAGFDRVEVADLEAVAGKHEKPSAMTDDQYALSEVIGEILKKIH